MEEDHLSSKEKPSPSFSDERVVKTSLVVDIIDILINGFAMLITGSVVMLAETFQGFSDLIVDCLVYIGMKRSKRLPTNKHPFGFGREIYVWSLFSAIIMFLVLASFSFYFGLRRFINPEKIEFIFLAYFILIISIITNGYSFSLALRRILAGRSILKIKKIFSQSTFLETKITFVSDLVGVLAAVLGLIALILFQTTNNFWFDGLGAIAVGLLMATFSIWLLKNIKDFIVGVSASDETKKEIRRTALEVDGVEGVLDLKAIVIGSNRLLVNIEIHAQSGLVTKEIEKLIDLIKDRIKEKIPSVYHIQVELETP